MNNTKKLHAKQVCKIVHAAKICHFFVTAKLFTYYPMIFLALSTITG